MKKKRRLTTVLRELEFEEQPTVKDEVHPCRECGTELPHHRDSTGWMPIRHDAPCGLPCLAGGVPLGIAFHSRPCKKCK